LRCQASAETPQRTDYSKPGSFAVGSIEMTFDDSSRPITATDKHAAAPSRRLVTTIYYPAASQTPLIGQTPLAAGGPFPMLMYSHGYSSSRDEGAPVAKQAASYGYIVVVPEFPLTNIAANNGAPDVTDAANQPGDVTYLIDQMLALAADSSSLFANAVDETRIGALGVSLGGLTTWLVSFHPKLHDPRIKAAVPIAGLSSFFAQGFYHTRELPVLILHGDIDAFIDYELNARRSFTRAAPNARLITIAKGTHAAFGAQLDADTTAALNALLAPAGADPSNPDGLGCGAVGATLQDTGPEFLASFGGKDDFIELDPNSATVKPCQGTEYTKPALDAFEQEGIAVSSAVAFFEAYFAKSPETRQDGCRYLLHEVPKNPAVKLE
jgi:dienelactone hydrolase